MGISEENLIIKKTLFLEEIKDFIKKYKIDATLSEDGSLIINKDDIEGSLMLTSFVEGLTAAVKNVSTFVRPS